MYTLPQAAETHLYLCSLYETVQSSYTRVWELRQSYIDKNDGTLLQNVATASKDSPVFQKSPPPRSMLSQPKDIPNLKNFNTEWGSGGAVPCIFV